MSGCKQNYINSRLSFRLYTITSGWAWGEGFLKLYFNQMGVCKCFYITCALNASLQPLGDVKEIGLVGAL